jgi:hypothetical protein
MIKSEFLKNAPKFSAAVINQIGGWERFKEQASDITNYGADGGTGGFTWYVDTVQFAADNLTDILQHATQLADEDSFQLIADFTCFKGEYTPGTVARAIYAPNDDNKTDVLNALAWFALEETARAYCEMLEDVQ